MNTVLRKMLALLLCAALCAGLIPAAFAEGFAFPDGTVVTDAIAFPDPAPEAVMAEYPAPEVLDTADTAAFDAPEDLDEEGVFVLPAELTAIEEEAFSGLVWMTGVKIPKSVTDIGDRAFAGCANLSDVYFDGSGSEWLAVRIGAGNEALQNAKVHFALNEVWFPVNAVYFPDPLFRSYVSLNIDTNHDGYLNSVERSAVTQINCAGTEPSPGSIRSLQGIELFRNLNALYCAFNEIAALDVSQNENLEVLYCASNKLTRLDVSHNVKLRWLSVSSNSLDSLDLSKNTGLVTLYAHYNALRTLDLSRNTELANLYAAYNLFTALDLHTNTKLQSVELLGNSLVSLNLSASTLLQRLYCGKNALTALDVRSNTLLELLDCHGNNLTALDVSRNVALTDLNAAENRLRTLDVSACTSLERLQCYTNQLTTLTLGTNSRLDRLNCAGNALTQLDIRQCPLLMKVYNGTTPVIRNGILFYYVSDDAPYLVLDLSVNLITGTTPTPTPTGVPITQVNFPDTTFRARVSQNYDTNRDGYLSTGEANAVTSMNLNNLSITSLKGIEYFPQLVSLYCNDNALTALDVSACTSLELLQCYRNALTTLTLGSLSRLDRLNCAYNDLRQLDIRQCPLLVNVFQRTTPSLQNGVISYYTNSSSPYLVFDQATTLISGSSPTPTPTGGVPITPAYFPDATFRSGVSEFYDKNRDGYLSTSEANAVTNMFMVGMGITTLKGIEYFPRLTVLRCSRNYLTALDISGLPNLQILECWGNGLSMLYVSATPNLRNALQYGTRSQTTQPNGAYNVYRCVKYSLSQNVYFECDEGINIY